MKINCIYIKKTKEEKLQTLDFTMVRCNPTYIHFPQDLESFQTLQLDFFFTLMSTPNFLTRCLIFELPK